MKRILILLMTVLTLSAVCFAAKGGAGKNVKWELKKGVLTFTGQGPMKDFRKDRPWRPENVKQVVIGEGVTSIGNNICYDCVNLVTLDIPSTIKSIGEKSFYNCENLSDVRVPFGCESIGEGAFFNCRTLIEVELPISMKTIGDEAFADCVNLTKARLSQSIETMGRDVFKGCKLLSTLSDLPSFVTTSSFASYGLNRAAVKNYWERKEEIAAKFGNASGSKNSESKGAAGDLAPSDVDVDIPFTGKDNPNTFALIIANENYGKLANVPFALNDGNTFARYCRRTLGLPQQNILQYNDASYGSIREALSDLRLINEAVGEEMKLIVYYAGHGAPDDATLEPYLIPVDAARVNKDVCISLASFYKEIGSMKLRRATVFLDACFSGTSRDGNMVIQDARGIARVPKQQGLSGKIAVLSATSGEQTAMPYNEKGHGMFTYFLLKRLQETKGAASLSELKEYVTDNVRRSSTVVNRKDQTPTFTVSPEASSIWDIWKFNE